MVVSCQERFCSQQIEKMSLGTCSSCRQQARLVKPFVHVACRSADLVERWRSTRLTRERVATTSAILNQFSAMFKLRPSAYTELICQCGRTGGASTS